MRRRSMIAYPNINPAKPHFKMGRVSASRSRQSRPVGGYYENFYKSLQESE
jgi:hypothetical protein